jgi:RNA polymerase sigma-70 factor (ECF subfamily)
VIYLVFNEGYAASSGESLTRADLSAEAIRLGRLLVELLPDPEAVGLYDLLVQADHSPVVELNRAVAVAMADGPGVGLALIDALLERGHLQDYHHAHAARADLCRRLGRSAEARASYERAVSLARQEPERRFLLRRLAELPK